MNIRLIPCAGLLAVTLAASGAHAATVKWMLQGVQFDDGGTATGSFLYDADINSYSNISVTTTAGSTLPGQVYQFVNPGSPTIPFGLFLVAVADPVELTPAFNLNLDSPLTNAGGTITLATLPPPVAYEALCVIGQTGLCDGFTDPRRYVTAGVVTTVIPIPAAVWLFGSGLIGLMGIARRKKSTLFKC